MPEDAQEWYLTHPITETLLTAPPGCGKTEGVARWIGSLVEQKQLAPPRRALGLTFSNKAKANLRSRLRGELGPRWWRWATVTNFHGWAFHIYQHHCSSIGREPLELGPQRGWQARLVRSVCSEYSCEDDELRSVLRTCKVGAFDDEAVLENLVVAGHHGAIEYESRLRAARRVDFDDLLRLGLLVLEHPGVVALYRKRFALVVVDEVQDLSIGQFDLAAPIGPGRTLWAGDAAQGIYGFAGAQPTLVIERIRERGAVELELTTSFRSSPAVLRAVSVLSTALGGQQVESAQHEAWADGGSLRALRSGDVTQEASWIADTVERWMADDPLMTVGVIARTGSRRKWVDEAVRVRQIPAEIWDFPAHKPLVVELLVRHLPALDPNLAPAEAVQELYLRYFAATDPVDLDSQDELSEAFDTIGDLTADHTLAEIVAGIRVSSSPDEPVGAGLHLLNGHVGKGQQFDRVIVVGLEEAFLPHFFAMKSGREEDLVAELALLHVMASRAREQLILATCDVVPKWNGQDLAREQSRWFGLVEAVVDETVDQRGQAALD